MTETYVTVERAAPVLGFKPHALYRAIRENQFPFPFVRIGRQIRIDARAIGLTTGHNQNGEIESTDANQTLSILAA